jgi:hypothetical protein
MGQGIGPSCKETDMWLIELNIAGRRFTRHVPGTRRQLFGRGARVLTGRGAHVPHSPAA